jgi:hypothetical protein
MFCGSPSLAAINPMAASSESPVAALLPFFFFQQFGQKIRQRLPPRNSRRRVGLESVSDHLNTQRFALAAYLPVPALGSLAASRRNDVIIVDGVSGHITD